MQTFGEYLIEMSLSHDDLVKKLLAKGGFAPVEMNYAQKYIHVGRPTWIILAQNQNNWGVFVFARSFIMGLKNPMLQVFGGNEQEARMEYQKLINSFSWESLDMSKVMQNLSLPPGVLSTRQR